MREQTLARELLRACAVLSPLKATLPTLLGLAFSSSASAQLVACSELPAPLYGQGGSAASQLLGHLAPLLAQGDTPRTLVYDDKGACFGVAALLDPTRRLTASAKYWTLDDTGKLVTNTCMLPIDSADGPRPEFAMAAGDLETLACEGITSLPPDVLDLLGPVSSLNFVVPIDSTQEGISFEAAYYLYGFGGSAGVAPWVHDETIFSHPRVTNLMARALGIPRDSFRENWNQVTSGDVTLSHAWLSQPEASISFFDTATADANRDRMRSLAYQHHGQLWGYWPDATPTSNDKINIREGRYFLWYPIHLLARTVDGSLEPGVARLAQLLGVDPAQALEPAALDAIIGASRIPRCAMRVWRDVDFGPLYGFAPSAPCGCYFDRLATGATECSACEQTSDCADATDTCSYGYCEAGG